MSEFGGGGGGAGDAGSFPEQRLEIEPTFERTKELLEPSLLDRAILFFFLVKIPPTFFIVHRYVA